MAKASALFCNVNLAPGKDGIYRPIPLFSIFENQAVPSMGLGLYLAAHPNARARIENGNFMVGQRSVPMDNQGRVILNYRGPSGTHETYSAAWVLQSELRLRTGQGEAARADSAFKDKYIFFGFSAPGLFDIHSTPVDSQFPGVEIHATLLDNFLSQDFMTQLPFGLTLVFSGILVICCGMLTSVNTRALPMFSLIAGFLVLPVAAGILAYPYGVWLPMALPLVSVSMTIGLCLVVNYATEGRRRRFIKTAFHHYLSAQVIDQILQNPDRLRLGGERRRLSIFFSDLESFTSFSETLEPEELTRFLNQYLTAMTDIIQGLGGTIDKYEGDAIIAFWNAPLDTPDHADLAVRAALDCQARLGKMRSEFRRQTGKEVKMRIGINTGEAVVGNLGSNTRFDYTMIGDSVNLAARLESANKELGTYTMVSGETRQASRSGLFWRPLGRIRVKGRARAVKIYEPMDLQKADPRKDLFKTFDQGLCLYNKGDFHSAFKVFSRIKEQDPAADAYARICGQYMASPPKDWDGVWPMKNK
ncbi:MAG: adenylate/guanylate cyclase domain-containing protein [Desulfobacter sp.]|nr:adenylate/guanylate cyclase domain-containing protein [Desulfobacter sp.]